MKKVLAMLLAASMAVSLAACGGGGTPSSSTAEGSSTAAGGESSSGAESSAAGDASEAAEGEGEAAPAALQDVSLEGKVVKFNLSADPKTVDPQLNSSIDGSYVVSTTFECLLRDKGNGPEPGVAETWETSEDGLVWTFHLRDSKWSDGKPLTAQDFVYTWQRAVDPLTAAEYAYMYSPILNATEITAGTKDKSELGVKAIDDKTFEVTLVAPCGYFEELVLFPAFSPVRQDVVEKAGNEDGVWAKNPAETVCNGPFMVTEYTISDHLTLAKNPNYWNASAVKLDYVLCRMIVNASTALTAFRSGDLDWTTTPPPEETPNLLASGEAEAYPYIGTYYYVFNAKGDVEPLKDIRVRQAISMAIDRKSICDNVKRDGSQPAMGFVPPGFKDHEGKDFRETAGNYYMQDTANVEQAKALLAEAGFPDGQGFPEIEILYNTDDTHKAVAQAVQEMLKTNLGITVKLNNQEWAVFQDTRKNCQYAGMARHGWIGDYLDPQTFLDMYMSVAGEPNPQSGNGWMNADFDAKIAAGMVSTGADRFTNFYEAEKIMVEDAYLMPIYFYVNVVLSNPNMTNWYLSPTGKIWLGDCDITAAA